MAVRFRRLVAMSVLLAGVAVGGGAVWAAPTTPIEIPAILSLTGPASALGSAEAEGLRLLADTVNKSGGVRGRLLAFSVQDDQSSPQVALQLASSVIAKRPPIMIATTLVAGYSAILPLLAKDPVTYCLSAGMYPPKDSYMFVYGVPTKEGVRMLIKFFHDRELRRIATIFTNDATGQDFERNLDAALALPENRDQTVVARERFGAADTSANAQIASIKAAAPQALIAWGVGTPLGTVFHAMTDLGFDVPTAISAANLNYNLMKQLTSFLPKDLYFVTVPGVAPEAVPKGPLRTAASAYFNALKSAGVAPDSTHLPGWDPGAIIVSALETLGFDATPAQYRQYIETLHGYFGAEGEYDFRDGSQHGIDGRSDIVVRYDSGKQQFSAVARIGSSFLSPAIDRP